jgi:hypothetical protein
MLIAPWVWLIPHAWERSDTAITLTVLYAVIYVIGTIPSPFLFLVTYYLIFDTFECLWSLNSLFYL